MALTQQAIDEYVANPHHCPYCGSQNIDGGKMDWSSPLAQQVSCPNCNKSWQDVLKVVDIVED